MEGATPCPAAAGALVEVDGEARGAAPVKLELPVGAHRVEIAPNKSTVKKPQL